MQLDESRAFGGSPAGSGGMGRLARPSTRGGVGLWVWLSSPLVSCATILPATPTCPTDMVLIAAGTAEIGADDRNDVMALPPQRVEHPAYCIDRYEYPNVAGQVPRATVTWDDANQSCLSGSKRLCSEVEWERACRGADGKRYSYGDAYDPAVCNTPITGSGPGPGRPPVAASGAFPKCRSDEGVFDLNGNLSEWVADPWDGEPERFNRTATVDPEHWRALRGGTMWARTFYGQECLSRHGHIRTARSLSDDGFRCCADPKP